MPSISRSHFDPGVVAQSGIGITDGVEQELTIGVVADGDILHRKLPFVWCKTKLRKYFHAGRFTPTVVFRKREIHEFITIYYQK